MDRKEFATRRKRLLKRIGKGGIAIIPTAPEKFRNSDTDYPYRPDSDFYYVTGFGEPEAVAVLTPGDGGGEYTLFCREKDPEKEIWTGRRAGVDGARADFGADHAFTFGELDDVMPQLLENRAKVFYAMGCNADFDKRVLGWINQLRHKARAGVRAPQEVVALDHIIHDMRLIKSRAELDAMRRAAQVSADAHRRAMQVCRPGMMEYQLEAEFLYAFRRHGGMPSYNTIVGCGPNACVLHYTDNDQPLRDGELVLIDAGAELDLYAGDITRTFPVNGRFTPAQRAIYELVLEAQYAAIDEVKPGNRWNAPHDAAVKVLTQGLVALKLLKGSVNKLIKDNAYRRFYMHRTGHWLGMDVHDVGDYKEHDQWRTLEPGMVLTVEPGLYIAGGSNDVAKKWWDIGVRIEDDVAVTRNGHEVLSAGAPKNVDEIEALMAARTGNE